MTPGDIVLLEAGNLVPADGRLVESANLRIQEAILTGESEPIEKITAAVSGADLPLGDQRNMTFMGTNVTYGRGLMVVTDIGMSTQLGRVADMIQGVESSTTPLQRRLDQLGRGLALAALLLVGVIFGLGLLARRRHQPDDYDVHQHGRCRRTGRSARRRHHHPGTGRPAYAQATGVDPQAASR